MLFAKRVFFFAGTFGLIVLLPQYLMESKNGELIPPPINHPEFFYGFVGIAVACQVFFLIIARDPVRYRLMMIPSVLEKLGFSVPVFVLYGLGRAAGLVCIAAACDFLLGVLFAISYLKTPKSEGAR